MSHETAQERKRPGAERRPPPASAPAHKSGDPPGGGAGALRQRLGNQRTHLLMRTLPGNGAALPDLPGQRQAAASKAQDALTGQHLPDNDIKRDLASQRFRGDDRLERILNGEQALFLRAGVGGAAVAKVQQTLIELGFALPRAGADGRFGDGTGQAVAQFKQRNGIVPADPVVGAKTIGALDAALLERPPGPAPAPACGTGPISTQPEALPAIPLPTVTKLPANDLLKLVKIRQRPGGVLPTAPPLGETIPKLDNLQPVGIRVEPDGSSNCVKCIADWTLPQPTVDIFIATGDFSDEPRRSFPVQERSVSHCPPAGGGTFKEVIKRILPEAEPIILTSGTGTLVRFRADLPADHGPLLVQCPAPHVRPDPFAGPGLCRLCQSGQWVSFRNNHVSGTVCKRAVWRTGRQRGQ